jgi:hydrogenase expression/formation protein HypC
VCLGIPGQVVEIRPDNPHLATVEVVGEQCSINVGLLEPGEVGPGDWVLIHMGFAMQRIEPGEAGAALAGLQLMGSGSDGEAENEEEVREWAS